MKKTLKNIGTTLFVSGAMMLAIVSAQELSMTCGAGTCMSAGVSFSVPAYQAVSIAGETISQSTVLSDTAYPPVLFELMLLLKTLGIYLVLLGVVTLVVLELLELHYLRKLVTRKSA